ncbi:hypothetical protein N0V82_005027 [Gnomoniopsis sp. IMI 355080]|nr:hypothetical protein N0V82_005027 [Gnomoniopsis sp. IMI 355080]
MATEGFESLAGLRKQVIENCYFFNPSSGEISLIITHEPIGTYKAIVLAETRRRRDVLLSSDSFETVIKSLEHLFIKSTDAVQQYIAANEFRRLPSVVDDDDAVSSVSSYADEHDKDRLADSSLSLESELESAYESLSEDDDGTVGHSRVRTGGRPRSYDVRTVRRASRSRSRSRSRGCDRAVDYRKAPPPPPSRFPVHRSRAVDPPRPYAGPAGLNDSGNTRFPTLPLQMPPMPGQGFMAFRGSSDPRSAESRMNSAFTTNDQQRLHAIQQQREEVKRVLQEGQRMGPGFINPDDKSYLPPGATLPLRSGHPSEPGSWPPLYRTNDPRSYTVPSVAARSPPMPPQNPMPSHKTPKKTMPEPGTTRPPPMMHPSASTSSLASSTTSSVVSSSVSSAPTITASPSKPPEYSPALPAGSIDYRLVIKTPCPSGVEVSNNLGRWSGWQEHRILARTPPTRKDMSVVALRYVQQNLPHVKNGITGPLRAMVTRAVFSAGKGREESYDLAAYPESDFSKLCEIMKRSGDDDDRGGLSQVTGWPLFEVMVSLVK